MSSGNSGESLATRYSSVALQSPSTSCPRPPLTQMTARSACSPVTRASAPDARRTTLDMRAVRRPAGPLPLAWHSVPVHEARLPLGRELRQPPRDLARSTRRAWRRRCGRGGQILLELGCTGVASILVDRHCAEVYSRPNARSACLPSTSSGPPLRVRASRRPTRISSESRPFSPCFSRRSPSSSGSCHETRFLPGCTSRPTGSERRAARREPASGRALAARGGGALSRSDRRSRRTDQLLHLGASGDRRSTRRRGSSPARVLAGRSGEFLSASRT